MCETSGPYQLTPLGNVHYGSGDNGVHTASATRGGVHMRGCSRQGACGAYFEPTTPPPHMYMSGALEEAPFREIIEF